MGVEKGGSKPFALFVYFVVHVIEPFTIPILEQEKQGIFMSQKPRANTWVRPYIFIPVISCHPQGSSPTSSGLVLAPFSQKSFQFVLFAGFYLQIKSDFSLAIMLFYDHGVFADDRYKVGLRIIQYDAKGGQLLFVREDNRLAEAVKSGQGSARNTNRLRKAFHHVVNRLGDSIDLVEYQDGRGIRHPQLRKNPVRSFHLVFDIRVTNVRHLEKQIGFPDFIQRAFKRSDKIMRQFVDKTDRV